MTEAQEMHAIHHRPLFLPLSCRHFHQLLVGNTSGIPAILYKSGAAFLVNHFLLQRQAVKTVPICDDDRGECLLHLPCLFATGLCRFWDHIAASERVSRNNRHSFKHRCC
jgi:hypothetical protein